MANKSDSEFDPLWQDLDWYVLVALGSLVFLDRTSGPQLCWSGAVSLLGYVADVREIGPLARC